jgi:hypothetical protein
VSNTQARAGIGAKHDSQVHKALGRLRELGLVVKYEGSPGRTSNAWTLSAAGEKALVGLDAQVLEGIVNGESELVSWALSSARVNTVLACLARLRGMWLSTSLHTSGDPHNKLCDSPACTQFFCVNSKN